MLHVSQLNGFNANAEGPAPAHGYVTQYLDTSNSTTYTFSASNLGTPHSTRLIVVAIAASNVPGFLSTVTVNGVSATSVINSGHTGRHVEMWQVAVPNGSTGDIVCTFGGAGSTNCTIGIWALYPASTTAVDALGANGSPATTRTLTDLAKTSGGFACFAAGSNASTTCGLTGTGAETITEHYDAVTETVKGVAFYGFTVTATTTADDYTFTWGSSDGHGCVGATWA